MLVANMLNTTPIRMMVCVLMPAVCRVCQRKDQNE